MRSSSQKAVLRNLVVEEFSMATTTAVPPAAPEAQASLSPFARVIGVFFSPGKTFEDIVRKPGWVLPLVLTTILSIGVSFSINQRINWREFMSQQIEKSPRSAQMAALHLCNWCAGPDLLCADHLFGDVGRVQPARRD